MSKLRWKWIGYHAYSNFLALIVVGVLLFFFLPTDLLHQLPWQFWLRLGSFSAAGALLLGLFCGFSFTRNIRSRMEEISVGAKNLSYGNLTYRLPFTDDKELGDIALAFNDMADRLQGQVAALQTLAKENEELIQKTKATAITEERQRLARELHDAVSQQLFAMSMTAATAARIIHKQPEKCATLIENIENSAAKAQAEMRALLLQLRPVTLENEKLVEAIESLARELESKQGLRVDLDLQDVELPVNMENQLYRVVQEGLSNVLRHAEADKVQIRLAFTDKQKVLLRIEDNGRGFDAAALPKTSYGLKTIRERISGLGGSVDWLSYPGQGTRLEVRLPVAISKNEEIH